MAIDDCNVNCGIDAAVRTRDGYRRHVLLFLRQLLLAAQAISGSTPISSVSESNVSVNDTANDTAIAANGSRLSGYIQNISGGTIWVSFGGTAVENQTVRVLDGQSLPLSVDGKVYTGAVSILRPSGAADIIVVEAT